MAARAGVGHAMTGEAAEAEHAFSELLAEVREAGWTVDRRNTSLSRPDLVMLSLNHALCGGLVVSVNIHGGTLDAATVSRLRDRLHANQVFRDVNIFEGEVEHVDAVLSLRVDPALQGTNVDEFRSACEAAYSSGDLNLAEYRWLLAVGPQY